jgi:hypothetical protein
MRIYVVSSGLESRLVRAPNRARALGHVAKATLTVELADQESLIHLLTEGVTVEDAVADAADEAE